MFDSLWTFVLSVLQHWISIVTGSLVSLFLLVAEKAYEKPIRWKTIFLIFGAGVMLALFFAWQDEYTSAKWRGGEVQVLQKELAQEKAAKLPDISGSVSELVAGPTGEHKENCLLTMLIHVRNRGASTAFESFAFSFLRNGQPIQTDILPPETENLLFSNDLRGPKIHINASDNLLDRAGRFPVATNVPVDAWLQVLAHHITRDECISKGNVLSISFADVATGRSHLISYTTSGGESLPLDLGKLSRETH